MGVLLTTPSAPLRNGIFVVNGAATPPLKGGEWAGSETAPFPSFQRRGGAQRRGGW